MSLTVTDVIRQALLLNKAIGWGDPWATNSKYAQLKTDGLNLLNAMISGWSAAGLKIPSITKSSFSLVASTNSYTIGSGADFNTARPVDIVKAFIRDSNNIDHNVAIKAWDEYARIIDKSTESRPTRLFYNPTYANGTIYVWPTPSDVETIHLELMAYLSRYTAVSDSLSLPEEYEEPLIYNLAVKWSPQWNGLDRVALKVAEEGLKMIERNNLGPVSEARLDSALSGGGRQYNIESD